MEMNKVTSHSLLIDDRQRITITDVEDVASFNEQTIMISSKSGNISIKGEDLHVLKLDLEEGKIVIEGTINSATYLEKKDKKEKSWFSRIFK